MKSISLILLLFHHFHDFFSRQYIMKVISSGFMATSVFTHTVFTVSKNEMESVRGEGMACPKENQSHYSM